jgi:predicted signal transduction protein with EAL and GGDEF domain
VREGDTVARLGGDEFAILASGRIERAQTLARMIQAVLEQPIDLDGQAVDVGCSIGIAHCPAHGEDPSVLLRCADVAMYAAKREKSGAAVYDARFDKHRAEHLSLLGDLRRAITGNELLLHYQPKVDLRSAQLIGVEALVRWQHPERGLLSPQEFIPLAEQSGLIGPLGDVVLRAACAEAAGWPGDLKVAVNVSAVQFGNPGLFDDIARALAAAGLPPQRLEIEITETVLLENEERNVAVLRALVDLGIGVALDDFGTGYASLAYLATFPFSKIKIDRRFTRDILARRECAAIVCSAATLGLSLGLTVVAEGVETAAQLELLRLTGVGQAQGFLFGAPMPAEAVAQRIGSEVFADDRAARAALVTAS